MTDAADVVNALIAIAAVVGIAIVFAYRRPEKPFNPICRNCGRHAIFHGRIGSECPGLLSTRFEEME